MANHEAPAASEAPQFGRPNVRLEVQDFGPVAQANIQLRPLTVFVGPSNTGKTYLALLIYALHYIFAGFPRLPLPIRRYRDFDMSRLRGYWKPQEIARETLEEMLERLTQRKQIRLSELPKVVYQELIDVNKPESFSSDLQLHLFNCFDAELPELIRRSPSETLGTFRVSLNVSDLSGDLWRFTMESSNDKISEDGSIQDILLRGSNGRESSRINDRLIQLLRLIDRKEEIYPEDWYELLVLLINPSFEHPWGSSLFYLPAARGGIMQSHRIIASASVGRSTRVGLEPIQIPTLPSPVAEFVQTLIEYDERRTVDRSAGFGQIANLAKDLEKEILSGDILINQSTPGSYPEFVYRPQGTKQNIRLNRASSMVSELTPVVLLMRGHLKPGDTFIIEEPEAHLHPAAQTRMAKTLAALVRAGVRVVVTTHSDWLLQEMANLVREGELRQAQGQGEDSELDASTPPWLNPQEVGVWLFKDSEDGGGATVQEIPFDRVDGLEPEDYADVAETLYNDSAKLQNQLEAIRGRNRQ